MPRQEVAAHANDASAATLPLFLCLLALSFAESSLKAAHSADARSARWKKCADGCTAAAAAVERVSYIDTETERNMLGSVLRPLIRPPLVSLPSFPPAFSISTFQQLSDVA